MGTSSISVKFSGSVAYRTLARFWSLIEEIEVFATEKGKEVKFLDDDLWLNDLAFLIDITNSVYSS